MSEYEVTRREAIDAIELLRQTLELEDEAMLPEHAHDACRAAIEHMNFFEGMLDHYDQVMDDRDSMVASLNKLKEDVDTLRADKQELLDKLMEMRK